MALRWTCQHKLDIRISCFCELITFYHLVTPLETHEACIFHSDRGSQYTSNAVMELLQQYGLRQSFLRDGMSGDSAWSESFFATMKKVLIHRMHYATKEPVRAAVFDYIYCFYNVKRIQKRLGYMSPREYLRSLGTDRLEDVA